MDKREKGDDMATDTSKAPKPAKPVKTAATTSKPRAAASKAAAPKAASPAPKTPKPVKPKKGPTVDTSTINTPNSAGESAKSADIKTNASQLFKDSAAKL